MNKRHTERTRSKERRTQEIKIERDGKIKIERKSNGCMVLLSTPSHPF